MTTSDNKMAMRTASDSSGTTNKNGTIRFKEWMMAVPSKTKKIHYYFKGWIAAIRVVK